ncbi:MAG TPA: hypothetical protein VKC66_10685 [Xanthobacteraceae bacterium]|nr:hypothetical protein [Xanthobacteraceae bacterium]
MDRDRLLYEDLPYRMRSVDTLNLALHHRMQCDDPPPIAIHINGKLAVEGNLNAFTNPAIEAGLVHCRALLEFLGLCMINARLGNVRKRRISDIGIEHFSNANGPLPMVTPEDAVSRYDGGREEAEEALISIFQTANKDLAHITTDLVDNPKQAHLVEIASRGVPSLVVSHLYTPLGLKAPEYKLTHRRRSD